MVFFPISKHFVNIFMVRMNLGFISLKFFYRWIIPLCHWSDFKGKDLLLISENQFFLVKEIFTRIVSTFLGFVCCSMCTHLVFWFSKINGYSFKATPFFSLSESLPNGKNQKRTRNCHDSNYNKNNNEKKSFKISKYTLLKSGYARRTIH